MLRVGIFAESFNSIDWVYSFSARNYMLKSGNNLGNLAFWNASKLLVSNPVTLVDRKSELSEVKKKIDLLLIPAANWLQPRYDFSWLAELIEALEKPVVVIGLGAQSFSESKIPDLSEGTVRFLRLISDSSSYFGVRGTYTKSVCEAYGVHNAVVLGCPSILTNNDLSLGNYIESKWRTSSSFPKTILHGYAPHHHVRHVEQLFFKLLESEPGASYVVQAPQFLAKAVLGEELNVDQKKLLNKNKTFGCDISDDEIINKIYQRGYLPYSIDSWIQYVSLFSRAIGTRIHGSVISMSAGIPTLCITHDVRTRELCEIMNIPAINYDLIDADCSVGDLFYEFDFKGERFDNNRVSLAKGFKNILTEHGMEASLHLKKFFA